MAGVLKAMESTAVAQRPLSFSLIGRGLRYCPALFFDRSEWVRLAMPILALTIAGAVVIVALFVGRPLDSIFSRYLPPPPNRLVHIESTKPVK